MAARKKASFEQQLQVVESIIDEMESGAVSLSDTVKQYAKGMQILNALEKELAEATQQLTIIRENADGSITEQKMEAHDEDIS